MELNTGCSRQVSEDHSVGIYIYDGVTGTFIIGLLIKMLHPNLDIYSYQ
jgi:hypothetical protein